MKRKGTHSWRKAGRDSNLLKFAAFLLNYLSRSAILLLLPACTVSFSGDAPVRLRVAAASALPLRSLDVLFFNDDPLRRLDSYQRCDNPSASVSGASRGGPKIVVALANSPSDKYSWADINSYERLMDTMSDYSAEDPGAPVMSGIARVDEGADRACEIALKPLLSRIEVASLSCDFHGRPYEGAVLEDVRIYLTNAGSLCPVFCGDKVVPGGFLNVGALNGSDMSRLAFPWMLQAEVESPVGAAVRNLGLTFYCYPNTSERDGLGTPFTRLVIEGTLLGRRYWYPLDIGRGALGLPEMPQGIVRGARYRYDITITRRGATSPDSPMETGTVRARLLGEDWQEGGNSTILFRHES